jgi:hypothetical protein
MSNNEESDGKGGWNEVKKARNRINSQRTRERERVQIDMLEAEKTRLWLSNDAIKYQCKHMRDAIIQIREYTADPSALQSRSATSSAHQSTQNRALSSLREAAGQQFVQAGAPLTLQEQHVQTGAPMGQVPQSLAELMIANDGGASAGVLSQHPGFGLNAMARRNFAGMMPNSHMIHPRMLNSAPMPASAMLRAEMVQQLGPQQPETDVSFYANSGVSQRAANMSHVDVNGGALNSLDPGQSEELKFDGLDSLRKRQRTHF